MIIIKVKDNLDRFINKNITNNINMYDINRTKNELTCKIAKKDYKKIKQLNYYSKIKIIKILGKKGLLIHIKKYLYDYLMLFLFIILIWIESNIIIDIEIKHENKEIRNEIKKILETKDIKKYTFKKTMQKLNTTSDEIIHENKDKIEWISINNEGMKYIVSVEERIKNEETKAKTNCHIIATNTANITRIINNQGIALFEKGDTVHPGEIIITGEIILNEVIKDNVCADAKIYGEVWYKASISYPYTYEEKTYTSNSRYNFLHNGNYLFKKNYSHYDEKIIKKIGPFKIIKQIEYKITPKEYTYEEARIKAIEAAKNKILSNLDPEIKIIEEKVLKETKNNSKIELEVFLSVEQLISKQIEYEVGG